MYPIRKGTAFYICLKWLNLTYCIQNEGESKWLFFLKFMLFRLLCSTLWFGVLFHMIVTIKDHKDLNLSEDLAIIMSMGGQLYSSIAFTRMHKEWLQICEAVTDFSKFGKPSKFEEEQKRGNLYASLMIWYSSIGTAAYGITAFLDTDECREYNERHNAHEICALGPIWLPVESVSTAALTVIDGIQVFSTLAIFWSSISAVFVIHNSAILTLTHLEKFGRMFHKAFEAKHENEIRSELYHCIKYHNHILRIGARLSHLTKGTLGHISLTSAICLGCIGNQILNELSIRAFMHLAGFAIGFFMVCYAGQKMIDETSSIRDVVYSAKWYKATPALIKDVKYIIARCEIPITLPALPLGVLSYPLYLMIMKSSYSYVTLLNQTT